MIKRATEEDRDKYLKCELLECINCHALFFAPKQNFDKYTESILNRYQQIAECCSEPNLIWILLSMVRVFGEESEVVNAR